MSAGAIQALTSAWKTIGELYELDDCLLDGSHVWNDAGLVIAASKELNRANSKQGRKEKVREWAANTPHACVIPQSSVDTVDDSSMQGALVIAAVVQKTKETCVDAPGKETASPNKSIFNDNEVVLLRALFNKNGIVLKATDTQLKVKGANSSLPLIRKACGLGLLNIYILRKTPSTMSIFFFQNYGLQKPSREKGILRGLIYRDWNEHGRLFIVLRRFGRCGAGGSQLWVCIKGEGHARQFVVESIAYLRW